MGGGITGKPTHSPCGDDSPHVAQEKRSLTY
nr:MAG TPA: hypothetical protein [Caudoviricetes sp.]